MKSNHQNYILEYSGLRPLRVIAGFFVRPGLFDVYGAMAVNGGVNFTIHTHMGTACELLLFHRDEEKPYAILPFPKEYKIGDVYSMIVFGLDVEEFEYGYRIDGPNVPEKGLLFDKRKILLDPYARAVTGQHVWGQRETGAYHARVVRDVFDWGDMPQSSREISDLIIYELHVRGFTRHASSMTVNKGTFRGIMDMIPYLKELGINAVELMPVFEFDETAGERTVNGRRLLDYWGYNTVSFFSPNTSYASSIEYNHEGTELKEMIRALHNNGIEVILDVVFNHTSEGNEKGPCFCFKGIDNNIYYMLTPEGYYYNFSGCGNTLNCNHPVVRQMILECLRYWTVNYRIDGFRFDLASILGRNEDGSPLNNPPLLESLANDPVLSNVKLIAEAWDAGGMYQVGCFPANFRWAEWNGRYRDSLRSFLKGDCWEAQNAAWSVCGSKDLYGGAENYKGEYIGYNSSVNFITCHDGFTLYDLYSYNEKHNENNGWENTDGTNDNRSWNCGQEGDTVSREVLELRYRMIRNACAVLMCSRGTPMFLAGDEFGNTQFGNNNAYCQDNEISWLDWSLLEKNRELFEFFKFAISFRKRHPVIRQKLGKSKSPMDGLHTYDINGEQTPIQNNIYTLCVGYAGYDTSLGRDDIVYMCVNTYWEEVGIRLPFLEEGTWHLCIDTFGDDKNQYFYETGTEPRVGSEFVMHPRSVAVFYKKLP